MDPEPGRGAHVNTRYGRLGHIMASTLAESPQREPCDNILLMGSFLRDVAPEIDVGKEWRGVNLRGKTRPGGIRDLIPWWDPLAPSSQGQPGDLASVP